MNSLTLQSLILNSLTLQSLILNSLTFAIFDTDFSNIAIFDPEFSNISAICQNLYCALIYGHFQSQDVVLKQVDINRCELLPSTERSRGGGVVSA